MENCERLYQKTNSFFFFKYIELISFIFKLIREYYKQQQTKKKKKRERHPTKPKQNLQRIIDFYCYGVYMHTHKAKHRFITTSLTNWIRSILPSKNARFSLFNFFICTVIFNCSHLRFGIIFSLSLNWWGKQQRQQQKYKRGGVWYERVGFVYCVYVGKKKCTAVCIRAIVHVVLISFLSYFVWAL